jgi:hypothetical protein
MPSDGISRQSGTNQQPIGITELEKLESWTHSISGQLNSADLSE